MNLSPADSDSLCSPSRGSAVLYDRGTGSMAVHLLLLYPIQSDLLKNLREGKPFFLWSRGLLIPLPPSRNPSMFLPDTRLLNTFFHRPPSLPSGFPPNRRGYRYSSPFLPLCALALKQPRDQISRHEQEQPSHSVSS